jgi:signal transduction histidine kinase
MVNRTLLGGERMNRRILTLAVLVLGLAGRAHAADFGTAAEARAMLDKTVAALKADKAGTLAKITKGEGGFKDRDLYPFCGGPDGIYTAHGANPALVGKSLKEIKDKAGKAVGEELYGAAREGTFAEVEYVWPRPGASTDPVPKVSFVTRVGDQVCAVGYYK